MTTNETSETPSSEGRTRTDVHVDIVIAVVVIAAVAATALNAFIELSDGRSANLNWSLFGVFTVLLLVGETTPASWMKMANGGIITMSWTFAFSLVLLGSPTGAVIALAVTTLIGEYSSKHDLRRMLFNTAQVSLALAFGGLTLVAFGIHEPLTGQGSIPVRSGLAILCSGLVVFVSNGVVVCYVISVSRGERFMRTMRNGFAVSMTADGALLALAPIFLVSLQFSIMMAPLLGVAAAIVYQSAVQALERSHDANHDTLTELRNRRAFIAEVDEYLADRLEEDTATVLLIDLDGFKGINDRLGHQAGDAVLCEFAARLTGAFPTGSIVARLGGDEFAALVPDGRDEQLDLMAIHRRLVAPMTVDGVLLSVGASIGVASCPLHGEATAALLHAADIAMYRAKQFQTGVEYHDATAPAKQGRRTMLRALSEAIGTDQLSIRYEPLVHMRDRVLVSVAAQVQWTHPTEGAIALDEVIDLAEHTDISRRLADYTLERAVRDVVTLDDSSISLTVNVSAGVLHDPHFAKRTLSTLHRLQLRPARLELEIAERCLAKDPEGSRATLAELRTAGVRISIDDFGTGYSSYLTLRTLAVDRLKVDRTFTNGMLQHAQDRVIVQSAIDLAHGFGIAAAADSVECESTLMELVSMGCDIAQGSVVAAAMSIDQLATWIDAEGVGTLVRTAANETADAFTRRSVMR